MTADDDEDVYMEMGQSPPPAKKISSKCTNKRNRGFRAQFRAFTTMALPYFYQQGSTGVQARVLFCIMVILTLLNSAVRVVFSYIVRDFWSALSQRNVEEFYTIMRNFIIALIVLAPINVFYRFQRQTLAIHWREWMTDRILQLYASNKRVYYGLERSSFPNGSSSWSSSDQQGQHHGDGDDRRGGIDNPDQRITEDVRSFTEYSLTLFLTVLMAFVDLLCFSAILFSILPRLFLAIAVFASFGTLMTVLIGRVLVQLNFEKLQREADFRYSLVRIRENAESIAFLSGEEVEKRQVRYRFARVIDNMHSINRAVRNLDFFTTYYTYLTWILPILVVAPQYFAGAVELGVVQQASASFSHVLGDLSILVTQWESLSEFSAGIDRLFTFLSCIQDLDPGRPACTPLMALPLEKPVWPHPFETNLSSDSTTGTIDLVQHSPVPSSDATPGKECYYALVLQNLSLMTPAGDEHHRRLIHNLNLSLSWGENLLIVGPSGAGKSSLLRAMAGLWNTGSGTIQRVCDHDVYFLPQKPYCAIGSLRDQLLYPCTAVVDSSDLQQEYHLNNGHHESREAHILRQHFSDEGLLEILRAVDLAELPERAGNGNAIQGLDAVLDWSNTLSLGEQQRLAFGRILVNQPRFVIMDESTSALDVESESRMYGLLQDMARRNGETAGLTYVSVGHRPTLVAFHNTKLILNGENNWSVEAIP